MRAAESDPSKRLWILITLLSGSCLGTWAATGVGVTTRQMTAVLIGIVVLLALSAFYTLRRPDERLARLARAMAELFLLIFTVGSLSYAAASLDRPLWDDVFQSWDEKIGFDWRFWLSVLDAHPTINQILATAYHSMLPQTVLAVVALVAVRAYAHLDTYLFAYGIAALVTVAVAAAMPALSPVAHLAITAADHPNIELAVSAEFQHQALALREGRMKMIDLGGAQGLVTVPSFHTVSAVLLLLAFSAVPYFRWASLVLNAVMFVSIPIEGSHYLVDVVAGAALGLAAWFAAACIVRGERSCTGPVRPRRPASTMASSREGMA